MSEKGPKLLDLIPKEKEMLMKKDGGNEERRYVCCSSSSDENNKLELRLGLPGDEIWCAKNNPKSREREDSLLSLGYFKHNPINGGGGSGASCCPQHQQHQQPLSVNITSSSPFLQNNKHHQNQFKTCTQQQNKGVPVMAKDASQPCCTRIVELQTAEKKAFSPSSANTAVPNTSQKRAAPPVVGWPPIRSFRKNLGSSSSGKPVPEPQSAIPSKPVVEKPANDNKVNNLKGQFVKINMDGILIGRKVDLSAHNNYDSLSSAVNELFRGLLAAQRDSSAGSIDNEQEQKPISGVLDGNGEYTLVYEDNEGDRMLVGDVPWHMFVSTVKRLRVLKSSDLASVSRGGNSREGNGKVMVEIPSK